MMKSACAFHQSPQLEPFSCFGSVNNFSVADQNCMKKLPPHFNGHYSMNSLFKRRCDNMDTFNSDSDYVHVNDDRYNDSYVSERKSSCRFQDLGSPQPKTFHNTFQVVQNPRQRMDQAESQWMRCCGLPPELLRHLQLAYSNQFPIELRHYCTDWIEAQAWDQINEEDPEHLVYASQLFEGLVTQIQTVEDQAAATDNSSPQAFILKMKLQEIKASMRNMYGCNPMELVRVIKRCLSLEQQLLSRQNQSSMNEDSAQENISSEIMEKLDNAQKMTNYAEQMLKSLQNDQELFIVKYNEQHKVTLQINQLQRESNGKEKDVKLEKQLLAHKQNIEKDLTTKARSLLDSRQELANRHNDLWKLLEEVQKRVVDKELIKWKRNQQYAFNGAPFEYHLLDEIQKWCELLAELVWKNRQQIMQEELMKQNLPINNPEGIPDVLPELNQRFTALLSTLVTSTFIVESQPPQVLKKESRFSARVRLLVGGKLNIYMTPPQVRASIISEMQARNLLKNDSSAKKDTCGDIANNQGMMEYHQQKGELSIEFRNMQLRRIRRADKRGAEAVTEEKFCILFQSDFQIGNGELMFQVWTLSLPVVVTVHGNQECNALATVLWDNQFNEPGRQPFTVPEGVPWPKMAELLNIKFMSMCGRKLSSDNLKYLATKLFGGSSPHDDFSSRTVTWGMFNKETMQHPNRSFTFWEWFYSIAKLTKEHLKGPWTDGLIIGFISKEGSQEVLKNSVPGTFLLRYSDSSIGGITIAWSAEDPNAPKDTMGKSPNTIWNLAPFSVKDFSIRSLADRIKDLPQLVTLYPSTPKIQAFKKYFSKVDVREHKVAQNGYILHQLVQNIESDKLAHSFTQLSVKNERSDCVGQQMMVDNPATPSAVSDMTDAQSPIPSENPLSPSVSAAINAAISGDVMEDDTELMLDYDFNDIVHNVNQMLHQDSMGIPQANALPQVSAMSPISAMPQINTMSQTNNSVPQVNTMSQVNTINPLSQVNGSVPQVSNMPQMNNLQQWPPGPHSNS